MYLYCLNKKTETVKIIIDMNHVWLLLGANLGNELQLFSQAIAAIESQIGVCVAQSYVYTSPPWGFSHANKFYNQALEVKTELSAESVLQACLLIEQDLGRTRKFNSGYQARIIDIDIVYYNSSIVDLEYLHIPHSLMHTRKFTLVPLSDIAPEYMHPILHKTTLQLLAECVDDATVTRLEGE